MASTALMPFEPMNLAQLGKPHLRYLERQRKREQTDVAVVAAADVAKALIHSTVFSLVAGYTLIEGLQKVGWMPQTAGSILEGALVTDMALKSISDNDVLGMLLPIIGAFK